MEVLRLKRCTVKNGGCRTISSGAGSRSQDLAGGSSAGAVRWHGGAMVCAICTGRERMIAEDQSQVEQAVGALMRNTIR
jgi:hypothetical protein